ncbi:hypothetical protein H5410_027726 [Solanum commersonii]|uniref:Uncharacterized protein n=1 Tax=Solanum commersonii TaxID=4109 RepID=A0A9J5Z0N8_SOLCO|nr:hypothetical protein H5410_027726 [Solanum commersonii]
MNLINTWMLLSFISLGTFHRYFQHYADRGSGKNVLFKLCGNSAGGHDGFTSPSYQNCWDIVGNTLPNFITHTNLVLLPKKNNIQSFKSNFVIKMRQLLLQMHMKKSLKRIMKVLGRYESQSGQLIYKGKSDWDMHQNTNAQLGGLANRCTWCPIIHAKKRKSDCNDLLKRLKEKFQT